MIDINISTGDLASEFNLSKSDVDNLLEVSVAMVTRKFAEHWDDVAKKELHSTRDQYRSAIEIGNRGRFTGVAYLNPGARLSNMIEMGASSYDMKTNLLNSSKVKYTSKGNPYITVPFRWATPSALGESAGFAGKLPQEIFNEVKKAPEKPLPLSSIGSGHQMPKSNALRSRIGELKSKVGNVPMTSKYEGVKRNAKGSGYVNFRRVSLNSDTMAFMHPGFSPKNLAERALSMLDIPHIVDIAIDNFLDTI
jgi:hypothetical protein